MAWHSAVMDVTSYNCIIFAIIFAANICVIPKHPLGKMYQYVCE